MRTRAIPRNAGIDIDKTAALNSPSWGLPQIRGSNHEAAGFTGGTTSVAAEGPIKPQLADDELACFERLLRCANNVSEYGSGGSTVLAASLGHCDVFSVESDPAWLSKVEAEPVVRDAIAVRRVSLNYANIGPTGARLAVLLSSGVDYGAPSI
jgi:hypothetical protein